MHKACTLLRESVRSYDRPAVILDAHTVLAVAATAGRQFSTPFEQRPDRQPANDAFGAAGGSRQQDVGESEFSTWMCRRAACQQHRNRQRIRIALLSRAAFLCGTFFGRAKRVPRRTGAKARKKQSSCGRESPPQTIIAVAANCSAQPMAESALRSSWQPLAPLIATAAA